MHRHRVQPRSNWQALVESQGMHFHTIDGVAYWDESAYYEFNAAQIDVLEQATYELDRMCLEAAQHVIDNERWQEFQIPDAAVESILDSWHKDEFTVVGRFDLCYNGKGPPKLLEYNADTPTALLEAAVIQWYWLKDLEPALPFAVDQFNSIHERLIEVWEVLRNAFPNCKLYFTATEDHLEDYMTVNYLRDTAMQAGWAAEYIHLQDLRWHNGERVFVGQDGAPIFAMFKLYPWEWMWRDLADPECAFGPDARLDRTLWFEPVWKMLLSNKAILAVLWELFPHSPYLLPAALEPIGDSYAKKPILAREGANVTLAQNGLVLEQTPGDYENVPCVYQGLALLPDFAGNHPVVGSWMVNGYACGIGIREDHGQWITGNTSRFVPHLFRV
jgi:glutathionylspermidine synthase